MLTPLDPVQSPEAFGGAPTTWIGVAFVAVTSIVAGFFTWLNSRHGARIAILEQQNTGQAKEIEELKVDAKEKGEQLEECREGRTKLEGKVALIGEKMAGLKRENIRLERWHSASGSKPVSETMTAVEAELLRKVSMLEAENQKLKRGGV